MWIKVNQCESLLRCFGSGLCTPILMRMAQAERMRPPEPVAGVRALPMLVMCRIETCQTMPKYAKIARKSPFKKLLRVRRSIHSVDVLWFSWQSQEDENEMTRKPRRGSPSHRGKEEAGTKSWPQIFEDFKARLPYRILFITCIYLYHVDKHR